MLAFPRRDVARKRGRSNTVAIFEARADAMPLGNSPLTRAIGMVASVIVALCAAHVAAAPLTNNDYYAARGSELLKSVEQYHLGPGEEHVRAKEYQSAWNDFDFILRAFPNHPQALLLMTQLCTQWRGPKCELNSAFERAIDVNPKASGTFVALGIYLYRTKHYGDAIQSYQRALTIDNDSMNAHYNLGLTYLETKQYELANEHAQRAYALGAPLPGLRDKLKKAGKWNPADPAESPDAATKPMDAPNPASDATSKSALPR